MLRVHRAERADRLVEMLGDVVAVPLPDPMEAEVVCVPTRGVERWLSQRLSNHLGTTPDRRDGVCAHVSFPFPARLVDEAMAAVSQVGCDADAWAPERAVWPLLEVVDDCLGEPWLGALAAHVGVGGGGRRHSDGGARRFTSVRHVAGLFHRYGVHRPEMLRAWAAGDDTDGTGGALPADRGWQAELWRRLRARIGRPSPAERLEETCAALAEDPAACRLPARVSLFGLTRLPASHLQVLRALAVGRDVHLLLLHPSPALWQSVSSAGPGRRRPGRRADDPTAAEAHNPLLASWGRDAREMQVVVLGAGAHPPDHHRRVEAPRRTLLERIQADVQANRAPPGASLPGALYRRAELDHGDRSIEVHGCHGRARQVEVVRDAILHLLADDQTLEARDVIVMCPDIEAFAPLIHATFGAAGDGDDEAGGSDQAAGDRDRTARDGAPPDLRVRLADRALRQTNPVLGVVSELLVLADARLTAAQVLDLAGRDPVRRRFGFDDDDLARMEEWVVATGVRWGFDGRHRAPFKLDQVEANTWRAGLDRVLLGAAMSEEDQRLFGGVLPLDDVDSGAVDLAGRFAELIDRLRTALGGLERPQSPAGWATAIAAAADTLASTSQADSWQRAELQGVLDEVATEAVLDGRSSQVELSLPEVRSLLGDRLKGRPTTANFRTGHLTVCTLVPMRSVPHRVVCLLGLDDGVFPRRTARDGDDLLVADPHVGDPDSRSEDRQLLLDALMAATDRLVITYTGRDERTNAERPPAVPVGELLDVIDRTVKLPDVAGAPSGEARDRVVVHHPLQPFDVRNFTVGRLVPDRTWSFDAVALEGARASSGHRAPPPPFLAGPLPATPGDLVDVDLVVRFVQHPVKAFLRQRLGVALGDRSGDLGDGLPVELDALERWGVGQRLLDARLTGAALEKCLTAELARGVLPPGALADPVLDEVTPTVERLVSAAAAVTGGAAERRSVEVNVRLDENRLLVGTVAGITGDVLLSVTFSRVAPKHRLAAWVRFLAVTATHPEAGFRSATVGRARHGAPRASVSTALIPAFEGDPEERRRLAIGHLGRLVDLYDRGMREPLPLYCVTSAAHAAAVAAGKDAESAARKAWESTWNVPREDEEDEHVLVLGGVQPLGVVLGAALCSDEDGEGWPAEEPTRFGRLARRLWDGLLGCERLVDR